MTVHDDIDELARRTLTALATVTKARLLLLEDQHADVMQAKVAEGGRRSEGSHSDPTARMADALKKYAHHNRRIDSALKDLLASTKSIERAAADAISGHQEKAPVPAEIRCPGYTPELRAQLGGCGRIIEHYTLANGATQNAPHGLCTRCRKLMRDDERAADHAA